METPADPSTVFIRRGTLIAWLGLYGISTTMVRKYIDNGLIKGEKLGNGTYAHYRVSQVLKALELDKEEADA